MKRASAAVAAAAILYGLLAGTPGRALAGHPFGTEDAGTQGRGNAEVEFNVERRHGNDGTKTTSPGNAITMGIGSKTDLAVVYAYDFAKEEDGTKSRRMGPVDATIKRVVAGGENRFPTLGIKSGISFPAAEGDQAALLATAIAEGSIGQATVFANVGAVIGTRLAGNTAKATSIRASLAGSREVGKEWYLLSELLWEKQTSPSVPAACEGLIGAKKEVTETLSVNGGVRWGLSGESPHVTYLLGFTLGFRGEHSAPAAAGTAR